MFQQTSLFYSRFVPAGYLVPKPPFVHTQYSIHHQILEIELEHPRANTLGV